MAEFEQIKEVMKNELTAYPVDMQHVGSTSVPGFMPGGYLEYISDGKYHGKLLYANGSIIASNCSFWLQYRFCLR
jgi:hypothetical protein